MSKYTTEVRYICEVNSGLDESVGYSDINKVIRLSMPKIFDFDFPIFDENYRSVLEEKILKHFYTREIGFETVGLWKLKLNTKLNEIMPMYNELYKAFGDKEFSQFWNTDYTRTGNRVNDGKDTRKGSNESETNSVTNGETNGETWNKFSNTPQGGLVDIRNDRYLTSAQQNTELGNSNSSTNGTGSGSFSESGTDHTTEDYVERIRGKVGGATYLELYKMYKDYLINIDMLVIDELSELFMMLW